MQGHAPELPELTQTRVSPSLSNAPRWLPRQAQLLAQGKLSDRQQAMLRSVGASLSVTEEQAERYAALQVGAVCKGGQIWGWSHGRMWVPGPHAFKSPRNPSKITLAGHERL